MIEGIPQEHCIFWKKYYKQDSQNPNFRSQVKSYLRKRLLSFSKRLLINKMIKEDILSRVVLYDNMICYSLSMLLWELYTIISYQYLCIYE